MAASVNYMDKLIYNGRILTKPRFQCCSMSFDRRHFLKFASLGCLSSAVTLTACTHRRFYNPDQDILLGAGRFKQNDKLRQVLAVVNLQQKDSQLVELDFLAHGIIVNPKNKKRLLTFEKNGAAAAEIDLDSLMMSARFSSSKDKIFNGHSVFDKSGNTLFCTETYLSDNRGVISIRDGSNFQALDEFPSYGKNPHQCQLTNDGSILVVSNTGSARNKKSQASVCYINVQSQQLLERVTLTNPQLNAGHFEIAADGSLIVTSAASEGLEKNFPGGVSIRSGKQFMLSMTQPEVVINRMTGEALSIAIDNKQNIAAVTHPKANMVSFWSINKRELIKAMSVPDPRGVTLSLDEKSFLIAYNVNTSVIRVDTKNLNAQTDSIMQPSYISGEHLYNWSKILTEIMPSNIY